MADDVKEVCFGVSDRGLLMYSLAAQIYADSTSG
jgi:hypothetical protein